MDFDALLRGTIDMHVHHGPDALMPRRVDALEAARQAQSVGMKAIVLKNHQYPTAPLAITINQLVPGIKVLGSICLDFEAGGLNPHALEVSAKLGARVAWMPTFSSANSRSKVSRDFGIHLPGAGFTILNAKGQLLPEVNDLLALIKRYDIVLATGHLSPAETFALVEEAWAIGIRKLVITHPSEGEVVDQALTPNDQKRLASMGAFLEFTCAGILPMGFGHSPKHTAEAIRDLGVEHCIMTSDLGQAYNPPPAEGMRMFIAALLRNGFKDKEVELMSKVNPAELLGLT